MSHTCPAVGCDVTIRSDHILMCKKHWWELPRADRDAVYDSYNRHGPGVEHMRYIDSIIQRQAIRTGAEHGL